MLVLPDSSALVTCGPTLRRVDIKNEAVLMSKQIGHSQIFQIMENSACVMVINFDGLITLLNKNEDLSILRQFYAIGKEIRHSSIDENHIAVSCELN